MKHIQALESLMSEFETYKTPHLLDNFRVKIDTMLNRNIQTKNQSAFLQRLGVSMANVETKDEKDEEHKEAAIEIVHKAIEDYAKLTSV